MACCGRWCERNSCNLVAALCFVLFALVKHFPKSTKSYDREWWCFFDCLCMRLVLADFRRRPPLYFGSIPVWLTFSEQNVRFCEGDQFNMTLFMMMYVSLVSLRSNIPSLNVYTSVYIALFSSHMIHGPKRPLMPAEDEGDSWELTHFSKRANLLVLIRSWALNVRVWIDIGDAFGRCVLQNWVFTRGVIKPCSDLLQVHIHIYCTQAFLMFPKDALKKHHVIGSTWL